MKKYILTFCVILLLTLLAAQEKLNIVLKNGTIITEKTAVLDSVKYLTDNSGLVLYRADKSNEEIELSSIQSLYFTGTPDTVKIQFTGTSATITNPLEGAGVQVVATGADVVVNAELIDNEVIYQLSGTTSTGSLKLYSTFRIELLLDGVHLTNDDGPAINIQSRKKAVITTAAGSVNSLADAAEYTPATEDQKSTLFSEGQLILKGEGTLNVSSSAKHGICSDQYIRITSGIINITSSGKDAIHCNDSLLIEGGKITVAPSADGFDCESGYIQLSGGEITAVISGADAKALKAATSISITNGKASITLSGAQSKGLKASEQIEINDGNLQFNSSGTVVLTATGSGFDPSYCTAIKCDSTILISGGIIGITQTGAGNKGISADKNIDITGGTITITNSGNGATYKNASGVTDSYNATCITADGDINLTGGTITASSSGTAGKVVSANGELSIGDQTANQPVINATTSGGSFIVSGKDYALPKTMKSDGPLTVRNGIITIKSANDGIKSETSVTIDGGNTSIENSTEGIESKIITINGGVVTVNASDDGINATMGTTSGGTEQNDGSYLYMNGGYLVVSSTKGDAIDSNGNIIFSGGNTIVHGPPSSPEEDIDTNGSITVKGGGLIGSTTNSNMNKSFATTSTQYALYAKSSTTSVPVNGIFRIQDNTGKEIITFRPVRTAYGFHFTSPELKQGTTYAVYTGGTYTGGSGKDGVWSGGSYTGGTLKATFTPGSSKAITLNY